VIRGPGGRRSDEWPVRQRQGRSRGAARPRPDLPVCPRDADPEERWLAADDVPDARAGALLWRNLFSEDVSLWIDRLCGSPAADRRRIYRARKRHRGTECLAGLRASNDQSRAAERSGILAGERHKTCGLGAVELVRPCAWRLWRRAEISSCNRARPLFAPLRAAERSALARDC